MVLLREFFFTSIKWCKGQFPFFAKHMRANTVPKPKIECAQTKTTLKALAVERWE